MTTLQNNGKPIDDFRLSNGEFFSIVDNSCKDVEDWQAIEILKEYPAHGLEIIAVSHSTAPANMSLKIEPIIAPILDEKDDVFIKEQLKDQVFICSVCDNKFPTDKGMRLHMRRMHES